MRRRPARALAAAAAVLAGCSGAGSTPTAADPALGEYLGTSAHLTGFHTVTGSAVHMHPLAEPSEDDDAVTLAHHRVGVGLERLPGEVLHLHGEPDDPDRARVQVHDHADVARRGCGPCRSVDDGRR